LRIAQGELVIEKQLQTVGTGMNTDEGGLEIKIFPDS
jgi:hypothetical protein